MLASQQNVSDTELLCVADTMATEVLAPNPALQHISNSHVLSPDYVPKQREFQRCNSSNLDRLHGGFLPRNQTNQDSLDRIKLCGVDERVGAHVEKRDELR